MKEYFINGLDNRDLYLNFLHYMLAHSDAFSLVYFKYRESERNKKTTVAIKKALSPFKVYAKNVNKWPGTETMDCDHIYRLIIYRADPQTKVILDQVEHLYDWNYSKYPMDLSFFKNGYAWFWSCSHEYINSIYISDDTTQKELEKLGLKMIFCKDVEKDHLYYNEKAIL